ncbi:2-oxoglutarate dehydrogenase E1 component [Capsulimonas corticalis]|uniref:oxoglutarate dehydrogenase (succinyl-transferring) n=1 Tax=Capsulimonas corticalis TaxID=2219043 RepID=A0A402D3R6_9BACT|nr:2-oxoglutarate dehydrogenase E1 component [Capsulimonas corticalis]BDI31848.1 2-oxoglutarate dehydrogenase E1 component [Capsulimonas corticalis]
MSELSRFFGPNAGYVLDLYDQYQENPESVDPETRAFFADWSPPAGLGSPPVSEGGVVAAIDVNKIVATARVARLVRELGHLTAHIDPLGSPPPGDPGLELETHGLQTRDLTTLPASVVGGPLAVGAPNALEALGRLRRVYSGTIGYEDDHIQVDEERKWIVDAIETRRFFQDFDATQKIDVLKRLTEVETFERFLHTTFIGAKRFSIEGTDMVVPILDAIIHAASVADTREIVMGMAHRGRLNVLAHILGKPYSAILAEFQAAKDESSAVSGTGSSGWTGDVKYHMGARRNYSENGGHEMPITLAPNPSHLEFVDPVAVGRARAAQETRQGRRKTLHDPSASLAILIHGDAAFPGQGVVAETLNLSQLFGYDVGGTIHIITNNQIGFTTSPRDSRSTLYASDLAKGFEIPIVHVNADDPEACIAAARMAHAYRERFGKDFLIDLVGYRRWGHNEGDEPSFTQPRMYENISTHPTVRELWGRELERAGLLTRDEVNAMIKTVQDTLQEARTTPSGRGLSKGPLPYGSGENSLPHVDTAVPAERLIELNEALLARPVGFTANAKLDRTLIVRRRAGIQEENGIEWAHAEALAFASILTEGTPIRLSGQDAERGTFSTRHSVLHDPTTGERYTPLQELPQSTASFAVYNSPLSETAALGFEYGYSMHAAGVLVLWEAQFGDFVNGAQVIVDQFLVSGNAKWLQTPSLVLLLPHGYEGQGPEHSSGRVERFLQLAASDNIRIVNCTTAAQYFHVLRRQAALLHTAPRPLIIMTPKGLLRHPKAASSLQDLATGHFQTVIDDAAARSHASDISRIVLSSGKVYVDLIGNEAFAEASSHLAAVRVEQLYPFPGDVLRDTLASYPNAQEIVWMQEEPKNMGAWTYMEPKLRDLLAPGQTLTYVGRPESASPAEGSIRRHTTEQNRIVAAALSAAPALKVKKAVVKS